MCRRSGSLLLALVLALPVAGPGCRTNPVSGRVINEYWKRGGKIQWFSDCALRGDLMAGIQQSIDNGAHGCYVQGGIADALVEAVIGNSARVNG